MFAQYFCKGGSMHFGKLSALALAPAFIAFPAAAAIDVPAGEACKITQVGAFACAFQTAGGTVLTEGTAAITYFADEAGTLGMTAAVALTAGTSLPGSGAFDVSLPYSIANWALPAEARLHTNGTILGFLTATPGAAVSGAASMRGLFTTVLRNGAPFVGENHATMRTLPDGRLYFFQGYETSACCNDVADGLWIASASWNFTEPTTINTFRFAQSFGPVPEPAAWALMILGFGAVGARLRRRPALPSRTARVAS
jgi:hypothetical protein